MEEFQNMKESTTTVIRTFCEAAFTEFQKNLATVLDIIVHEPSQIEDQLELLTIYAFAGATLWGHWRIHRDAIISPELKNKTFFLWEEDNSNCLTLEEFDQRVELLLAELKGLEIGFENFSKKLESEIEGALNILKEKIDFIIKEENPLPGSFAFEEVLMRRDILGYVFNFLETRIKFEEDFPFELDLSKLYTRLKQCDLKLKISFTELAKQYCYIELNSCVPEDYWWRHQYNFLEGPGANNRRNSKVAQKIDNLI